MIRAVLFDFYSVWTPDKFSYYLANGQLNGPEVYKELTDRVDDYYHGRLSLDQIAEIFRVKLGHPDITSNVFEINEANISPSIVAFIRELHAHFLKIGILANLGQQEQSVLESFNEHNQLFEMIASPLSLKTNAPLFSREVFVQALNTIGEPPANCLLISGNVDFLSFADCLDLKTYQFEGLVPLQETINEILEADQPSAT